MSHDPSTEGERAEFVPMHAGHLAFLASDAWAEMLQADRFSSVTCLHLLHHMPTPELQDHLFAEVCRVLRPGGALLVADALDQEGVRSRHREDGETFVPLDPATVQDRLRRAGFADSAIDIGEYQLLLRARKGPRH
jgi:predicted methyltransferase